MSNFSTPPADSPPPFAACQRCGTQLAPMMLACPACGRLVHADRLAQLAAQAEAADARGDVDAALPVWRDALLLLPAGSRQREVITQRVNALSEIVRKRGGRPAETSPSSGKPSHRGIKGAAVAVGGLGLLIWKFKFVVTFLLTKGKLLLLGLTNATTLLTMLLSVGVYWTVWGWRFALGVVLAIYVHEMGHVVMLRRYGFKSSAPTFIPGLGALVRMHQRPVNPHEDAAVGLAGPIYGMFASALAYGLFRATGQPIFGAIAQFNAWINLFNLLPLGPLDGGRAFGALSRKQRWLVVATCLAALLFVHDVVLIAVAALAALRAAVEKPDAEAGDTRATVQFVGLVAILSWMCLIPVPLPGQSTAGDFQVRRQWTAVEGAPVRGDVSKKQIALIFTGGEYGEGAPHILDALAERNVKAGFFLTGDFLRIARHAPYIRRMIDEGHYVGPHSDAHLLYAPWEDRSKTLVTEEQFKADLRKNIGDLRALGALRGAGRPVYFIPPFEWYNAEQTRWAREMNVLLFNFTPGSGSNRDYAPEGHKSFVPSEKLMADILAYEQKDPHGLNGFLLLMHLGSQRADKVHPHIPALIDELKSRGYEFVRVDALLVP